MNQIFFDNIASFNEWGIYLTSYSIGDAEPKENYIDIPFGDGSIDLTEALTGEVSYRDRPFEATFTLKPPSEDWPSLLRMINSFLNGRKRKIRVADESGYFLTGRCKTSFEKDGVLGFLTVAATCDPWLYKNELTKRSLKIGPTGTLTVNLSNSRKRVIPTVTTSDQVAILLKGKTVVVSTGSHRYTDIILAEGDNTISITGTQGTAVSFEYQEGAL